MAFDRCLENVKGNFYVFLKYISEQGLLQTMRIIRIIRIIILNDK